MPVELTEEIVMSNIMGNLAGEHQPDVVLHGSPYPRNDMSSYSNGNESFAKPEEQRYGPGSVKFNAKASWGLLKRGFRAGLIEGMNNGSARAMQGHFNLEALDPKHRFGNYLQTMHNEFKRLTDENTSRKLSLFFIWLDEVSKNEPGIIRSKIGGGNPQNVENFIRAGVQYLNGFQRKSYLLEVNSGRFVQNGKMFDTSKLSTLSAGGTQGWAIYVISPAGNIYASAHKLSVFHHSSFLAGRPVLSAGEMMVKNGMLQLINPSSGHYKPTMEQFINGLKALDRSRVFLHEARAVLQSSSGISENFAAFGTIKKRYGREVEVSVKAILQNPSLYCSKFSVV